MSQLADGDRAVLRVLTCLTHRVQAVVLHVVDACRGVVVRIGDSVEVHAAALRNRKVLAQLTGTTEERPIHPCVQCGLFRSGHGRQCDLRGRFRMCWIEEIANVVRREAIGFRLIRL